jgi:hypothetical protein
MARSLDVARLARLYTMIGFVTAVFMFTAASELSANVFPVAVAALGSVAVVTAIIGFLIAAAGYVGSDEESSGR